MTKVLLVEDDKSLREIYGVRLLAEGYDIISAGDGEEALAMAIKDRPALIISDVMMPKISGFDMLDILRSTTETRDVKVIMMTALSSEDQRARGEQLGADRYLVKSQVGIEDVVRTVHEVLGDAPTTSQAPSFSSTPTPATPQPAPSVTMPRPAAAPAVPPRAPQPPQFQAQPSPQPAAPAVQPPVSTPPPQAPVYVSPSAPQDSQASSGLPQPTAPFSTNRPSGLGLSDRVINPLPKDTTSGPDVSELISRELDGTSDAAAESVLTAPSVPPVPPVPPAAPAAQQPFTAPPAAPANNAFNPTPAAPTAPANDPPVLGFEETPRTASAPAPNPYINNSGQ